MSSTYSTSLRIELQATGANSGTWGTITNNNFSQSLEFAIAGVTNVACGDAAVTTLTNADGPQSQANNQARNAHIRLTGAHGAVRIAQFPATQKIYLITNATTSSIGTFSISGDSQVTVVAASEPELDIFVGTAVSSIGKTAFPSGNQLTGSLGTVLTSIELTGIGMTSSLGEETQETSYEAPSVQAVADRGNLTINISVDFTPTGVSATSTTGTLQGTFWNQVDDSNSSISWTEVHKAA